MAQSYTKTLWKDHVVDATKGEVLQQGTPVSASNLNHMEEGIDLAHQKLEGANRQTQVISHGTYVLNGDVNAPVTLQIEGRTLVPLQNTELDAAKYYLLADKKTKLKFSDSLTVQGIAKFLGVNAKVQEITRTADFENKVAGSTLENPHIAKYHFANALAIPTQITKEIIATGGVSYERLKLEDGTVVGLGTLVVGEIPQFEVEINIIEDIERNIGRIPRNTLAEKIQWAKTNLSNIYFDVKSHANGKLVTATVWNPDASAYSTTVVTHSNTELTWLTYGLDASFRMDANGVVKFLVYGVASDGTNSVLNIDLARCRYTLKSGATLHAPRLPLYEVTKEHYDAALVTWNEDEVLRRYPSVEGLQHIQNPYIIAEGDNLLPPFSEWNLNSNATVKGAYELEINPTAMNQWSKYQVPCLPNTKYAASLDTITGPSDVRVAIRVVSALNGAVTFKTNLTASAKSAVITTDADSKLIEYEFTNASNVAVCTILNPMLTLGDVVKPFKPRNPSSLYVEGKLGAIGSVKDVMYESDSKLVVRKSVEKDYVIDGALTWFYRPSESGSGYKTFGANLNDIANAITAVFTKYNGMLLKYSSANAGLTSPDIGYTNNLKELKLTVSNTESGFAESYSPTVDEIRAYFNGWQAKTVDTNNKPTAWRSLVDGADAPTQTLAYVAANKANGFIPYKLSYLLATPVVLEVKAEGGISVNGLTQIEVGSGVVIREKVDFYKFPSAYEVGNTTAPAANRTKMRIRKIIGLYKNGNTDNSWFGQSSDDGASYGANRVKLLPDKFDATAEYSISYVVFDRNQFTTNPLTVTATFANNIRTALDDNVKVTEDNKREISIQALQIYNMLVRMKAGGI